MSSPAPQTAIVRTRFAPSPSGHLHVGGARTALFCWAYAKGKASGGAVGGGRFMLRIEDTDKKRSSEAASLGFLEDLRWLGIAWDEGPMLDGIGGGDAGPYFQSERLNIYKRYLDQLLREGKAYYAYDSAQELKSMRDKAAAEKRNFRYLFAEQHADAAKIERQKAEGRAPVIRLKLPTGFGSVAVHDQVRGDVTVNESELDDFVLRKADGYPTYHFAVVVDDELMGVTHVIRAQEHLSNTHKHVLLQRALGFRTPVYAHVSIITNPDGSKMSKRDKDKTLRAEVKRPTLASSPPLHSTTGAPIIASDRWHWWLADKDHQLELDEAERLASALGVHLPEINVDDFRRNGYLPEVMINYLALLGWNPGGDIEKFDIEFLKERFDFDRVIKTPAKFDREKLLSFNADAIQARPVQELASRLEAHARRYHPDWHGKLTGKWELFARANQKRAKTLDAPFQMDRFFIMDDDDSVLTDYSADARKGLETGVPSGFDHLEALRAILADVDPWTIEATESGVKAYAESKLEGKGGLGKVAQPLRIAVSGGTVSPAIFDTLAILGKDSTLRRIDRCLASRAIASKS
jgi:glutamyl-tRNA synthetase